MNYFIPPSLYFKLLTAYRRGSVKVDETYKHFDLINEERLLENEIIDYNTEPVGGYDLIMPTFSDEYKLTTKGKTLLFRINWAIFFCIIGVFGAVIGWCISLFF
ncbi:hypothetical protein [Staphylococcus nepalensis]|uniref:hypothetical protein n=1 Tax=Staphylococcus nepalensis TaxID=214473 RepID=UPI000E03778F|nr:hypothetical protein [Staphylococcus nepalensis]SUM66737.1 Uncharacterised protein [Staphylococcus nepalensis]SUM94674.1 Uncharacterised protein [Staphylococcus nepalensis]